MFRFDIHWNLGKMRAYYTSINSLNANPTKWSNILNSLVTANKLFECVYR